MGEIWTGQTYGVPGGLEKFDISYAPEEMTEAWGLGERRFLKFTKISVQADEEYCAVGISKNSGSLGESGDVTSVEASYEEVYTEPKQIPLYPGQDVETGKPLFYLGSACLLFTATNVSYSINGNGTCPVPSSAMNDFLVNYATTPFTPAHDTGSHEIVVDAIAQIGNVKATQQQGIHTWTVEANGVIENLSPSSANLLTPSAEVLAVVNFADHMQFRKHTISMSKGKDSKMTSSWSIECFPTN